MGTSLTRVVMTALRFQFTANNSAWAPLSRAPQPLPGRLAAEALGASSKLSKQNDHRPRFGPYGG